MYKSTGRHKRSVGNSFYNQPPVSARILHSGDDRVAKTLTSKFRTLADKLDRQARKLDDIHSAGKEGQAMGSGVSLLGSCVGLGGVLAAPFTGGGSLLITAASAGLSIGGGVKGYLSDSDMKKETAKILDDFTRCLDEICEEEVELQCELQKAETLLDFFKESGIQEQILEIARRIEHKIDEGHAYAAAKPILDCCKSAAMFKSVLMSQGSTRLVRSVITIRFVLRKSKTFIKYIPKAISRSSGTFRHCAFPMTSVEAVIRAGPESFKTTVPVMKPVISREAGAATARYTASATGKQLSTGSAKIMAGKEIATKSATITAGKEIATNAATMAASKEIAAKSATITAGKEIASKSVTITAGKEFTTKSATITASKEIAAKSATMTAGKEIVAKSVTITTGKQIVTKSATITAGKEIASKSASITAGKEFVTKSATISAGKEIVTKSTTINAGKEIAAKSTTIAAGKEIATKSTTITATAGKEVTKETAKKVVAKGVVENTQVIGKNFVANTKDVKIVGSVQKSTNTLTKTAGAVSKLGVGLSVIAIAFDTYSLAKAYKESQKQHPKSEDVREIANKVRALIQQVEDTYRDLTLLHNELLTLFDETENASDEIDNDEVGNDAIEEEDDIDLGSDDVENLRAYLDFSQVVLG